MQNIQIKLEVIHDECKDPVCFIRSQLSKVSLSGSACRQVQP